MQIKTISYIAGFLAFSAMALLLYVVFCELFLGHDGHTQQFFKKFNKKIIKKTHLPVLLPIFWGIGLFVLYWVVSSFYRGNLLQVSHTGIYSVLPAEPSFNDTGALFLCLISLVFFILGSVVAYQIAGSNGCVLFCLNPLAIFMVLPFQYSLTVLLIALIYKSIKSKKYLSMIICAVIFVGIHIPFTGIDWGELLVLCYLAFIPTIAKLGKKNFSLMTGILAAICGFFIVADLCIFKLS